MSATTQPVFIVGTGRCGTRALYKMLAGTPGVEAHHEHLCTHVQQVAALYAMGEVSNEVARYQLVQFYGSVQLSDAAIWIDASNKASWVMLLLRDLFPAAKFVVLYRDGRKVVPSFLHKLGAECYDDKSVAVMRAWRTGDSAVMPPPEKRYWWNVPISGPWANEFRSFDQLQRICYHWTPCNAEIMRQLGKLPPEAYFEMKLEDLVSDPARVKALAEFIGIEPKPEHFESLRTPQNALFPMNFRLTEEQLVKFNAICGPMMQRLGYADAEAYDVHY